MTDGQHGTPDRPRRLADETELEDFLDGHSRVLAEFYTAGCGRCQSMEPVLGNVARESDVAVGLVNPRDDPPLIERFDVRRVPLLVYFEDGEPVARRDDGFVGVESLLEWMEDARKP